MKLRMIFGTLAVAWIASLSYGTLQAKQAAAAPGGKSVWDGVFSKEQADRGAAAFKANCSECHGNDLAGDGFAPALTGSDFMGNWTDLTVGDLFERIRISMPQSAPGSLSRQQNSDILAFILRKMNMPVGQAELSTSTDELKGIKFLAAKPGAN